MSEVPLFRRETTSAVAVLRRAIRGELTDPVLFVVAHPDDETIGAAALMARLARPMVLHVTNGAPNDRQFMSRHFSGTPDEYAFTRSFEARRALRLAGVRSDAIRSFGCGDLEAAYDIASIAHDIVAAVEQLAPAVIVTHAYEGGHPDHDAVAVAVHAAAQLARRSGMVTPLIAEMPLYHATDGEFVAGRFCETDAAVDSQTMTIALDERERRMKKQMFDCFETQKDVLEQFPIGSESFRDAPPYNFAAPPHAGGLWYESFGWPVDGELWRHLAAGALQQLGVAASACL